MKHDWISPRDTMEEKVMISWWILMMVIFCFCWLFIITLRTYIKYYFIGIMVVNATNFIFVKISIGLNPIKYHTNFIYYSEIGWLHGVKLLYEHKYLFMVRKKIGSDWWAVIRKYNGYIQYLQWLLHWSNKNSWLWFVICDYYKYGQWRKRWYYHSEYR